MLSDQRTTRGVPRAACSQVAHTYGKDVVIAILITFDRDAQRSDATAYGVTPEDQRVAEVLAREWAEFIAAKVKANKAKGRAA